MRVELSRGGGCFWNEEGQSQAEDFGVVEGVAQSSCCGSTPPTTSTVIVFLHPAPLPGDKSLMQGPPPAWVC